MVMAGAEAEREGRCAPAAPRRGEDPGRDHPRTAARRGAAHRTVSERCVTRGWQASVAATLGGSGFGLVVRLDEPEVLVRLARDLGEQVGGVRVAQLGRLVDVAAYP